MGELPDAPTATAAPQAPAAAKAPKPAPKPAAPKPKVKGRAGSPKAKVNVPKAKVQPQLAEKIWGMWLQIKLNSRSYSNAVVKLIAFSGGSEQKEHLPLCF